MITSQCRECIHFVNTKDNLCCFAFIDGIPFDILSGNFDHTKPHNNDNGIRFERGQK